MVFHSVSCVYKCNWRQMRYLFNTAVSSLIRLIILVLIIFCSYCKPICRLFLGSVQCYFIRQVVIIKLRMRFKAISSRVWCLYTCLQIHALFFSVHTVLNSKKYGHIVLHIAQSVVVKIIWKEEFIWSHLKTKFCVDSILGL